MITFRSFEKALQELRRLAFEAAHKNAWHVCSKENKASLAERDVLLSEVGKILQKMTPLEVYTVNVSFAGNKETPDVILRYLLKQPCPCISEGD